MSSESYNYLCMEIDRIIEIEKLIQDMADRLASLGYAEDVALETQYLLLSLRQSRNRMTAVQTRLGKVWYAISWWDSGDSDEDGLKQVLQEYRSRL